MNVNDVKSLPMAQKIEIMETIWEDLRDRFEHLELSPQLKKLLDQRRSRVHEGSAQLLDWDSVKASIGRP